MTVEKGFFCLIKNSILDRKKLLSKKETLKKFVKTKKNQNKKGGPFAPPPPGRDRVNGQFG